MAIVGWMTTTTSSETSEVVDYLGYSIQAYNNKAHVALTAKATIQSPPLVTKMHRKNQTMEFVRSGKFEDRGDGTPPPCFRVCK